MTAVWKRRWSDIPHFYSGPDTHSFSQVNHPIIREWARRNNATPGVLRLRLPDELDRYPDVGYASGDIEVILDAREHLAYTVNVLQVPATNKVAAEEGNRISSLFITAYNGLREPYEIWYQRLVERGYPRDVLDTLAPPDDEDYKHSHLADVEDPGW